ncbi:hypothetical protein HPB50_012480 [Hyalomma asiaticum]|uniref:Uncharacterized protein n=1 Tax=Hyalomma asiaticum TaxID=266040 RepID=A0ACB7SKD5_HYAAI|nr:hypothetical protein HPB50_012480 [Hyalomma asiaticum]
MSSPCSIWSGCSPELGLRVHELLRNTRSAVSACEPPPGWLRKPAAICSSSFERRGPGHETPSKEPKLSSGGPCRRGRTAALRGRLSSAMCTPVPARRRRLRKNETVSPTATAVGSSDSAGSRQQATASQGCYSSVQRHRRDVAAV